MYNLRTLPGMTTTRTATPLPAPTRFLPPDDLGDAALLAEISLGDERAFETLYDRLSPRVYGVVKRVLRDPAQSEEVTQEVFAEVWRIAPRFDGSRGSVSTWIATIAHRRAIDRVRSEQAARDRDATTAARDVEIAHDPVQELVLASSEYGEVRCALAGLTELQRQAIELAYYGGHTYREVAELLDTPLGTVKSRIRDGLLQLRETLLAFAERQESPCASPVGALAS